MKNITLFKIALAILTLTLFLFITESVIFDFLMRVEARRLGVPAEKFIGNPAMRLNFSIPVAVNGFGLDFKVHDYAARNFSSVPAMYTTPVPLQKAFYGSPPLLHFFFRWVRLFPPDTARTLWLALVLAGTLALSFFWLREANQASPSPDRDLTGPAQFALAVLFMFSYPVIFSFERGASDFPVLFLYSAGAVFLRRRLWFALGAVSVIAALLKVYPLFPALALSAAAFFLMFKNRRVGLLILGGQAAAAALTIGPLFKIHWHYARNVIWSVKELDVIDANSHSLPYFYGKWGWIFWGCLYAVTTISLILRLVDYAASGRDKKEPLYRVLFTYACLLGMATYVSSASYDYSLILLIPLFALCLASVPTRQVFFTYAGFILLLAGYSAPRWIHVALRNSFVNDSMYAAVQAAGLLLLVSSQIFSRTKPSRPGS